MGNGLTNSITDSTSVGGLNEVKQEIRQVDFELGYLNECIDELEHCMDILRNRLSPVLRDSSPNGPTMFQHKATDDLVPLAKRISDIRLRLNILFCGAGNMIDSLEL